MITITRVTIENFQSHENTVLDFIKGLNVIVGPSDQGKSAVLRAIKWVLFNEPRGTDFIRQGTSTAKVSVELSNGYTIIRERSKSKNRYVVMDPDNGQRIFEGFGNEVPEEVIKAHGIPKVVLDTDLSSSLNVSDQLEGPFLLSESPSVRAKAIGRLTGLHIIDKAIRDCMVDLRRENQTSDRLNGELEVINRKIDEYKALEGIKLKIDTSESFIKELGNLIEKKESLERYELKINTMNSELEEYYSCLKKLEGLSDSEVFIKNCEAAIIRLNLMQYYRDSYKNLNHEIFKTEEIVNKTQFLCECSEKLDNVLELNYRVSKLTELSNLLNSYTFESVRQNEILEKTEKIYELDKLLVELSNKTQKAVSLNENYKKIIKLDNDIAVLKKQFEKSEQAGTCEDIVKAIQYKIEILSKLEESKGQLEIIQNYIGDGLKYIEKNKQDINNMTNQYSEFLRKAGKCPLCNSTISENKISELIKHYEEVHK